MDELASGTRQEGIYSGFTVLARKLSTGIVLALVGPVLAWSGYSEGLETQSPAALTAIRLLITLLPAALLITVCVVAWFYPLTRQRHIAIQQELASLREARLSAPARAGAQARPVSPESDDIAPVGG